jgi:transposase
MSFPCEEVSYDPAPTIPTTCSRGDGGRRTGPFPKGNLYVELRAEFGPLDDDQLFADLYPPSGRPVDAPPWRLALVMVMQYIKGLTDRQAADAVRRCMDWQYALSLEVTDPGFDFSLLHDFRQRLLAHEAGPRFLGTFLPAPTI